MSLSFTEWRRYWAGTLFLLTLATGAEAQSDFDLAVEAVRAVKSSDLARAWSAPFAAAPAAGVVAWLVGIADSGKGPSPSPRIGAQRGDEGFRLAAAEWRCAHVADRDRRVLCRSSRFTSRPKS